MIQPFNQPAPQLGNQFDDDALLRAYLSRVLPPGVLSESEPGLREMGELSGGPLYRLQLADRPNEPRLVSWDAWGERVDAVETTPLWKEAERLAAEKGVVATAYEGRYGPHDRVVQFALAYLFHPSTDVYTCPLAMTDGAAKTLLRSGARELIDRALPRLTSRDPRTAWTSGQWMTESTGGSDVGISETVARLDPDGGWRLWGRKWFTSAVTSQMALTLARPEGNGPGGDGLALFYVETRDDAGRWKDLTVARLKDKLGTRKLPTAELWLEGVRAVPVTGLAHGVKNIVPMLQVTRTWNSVTAASFMRRGIALARDFAARRVQFGAPLSEQPLHVDTLDTLEAETAGAFLASFLVCELMGKDEARVATEQELQLLRVLASIVKLTTGRQAVDVVSEVVEAFGGAGYLEDTGIAGLLRDTHVLPIWEGTTNVLSLDAVKALAKGAPLAAFRARLEAATAAPPDGALAAAARKARGALDHASTWFESAARRGKPSVEAGARRLALTLGRALELALLVEQAGFDLARGDARTRALALRFARSAVDLIHDEDPERVPAPAPAAVAVGEI